MFPIDHLSLAWNMLLDKLNPSDYLLDVAGLACDA